jgi:hypothetical protein
MPYTSPRDEGGCRPCTPPHDDSDTPVHATPRLSGVARPKGDTPVHATPRLSGVARPKGDTPVHATPRLSGVARPKGDSQAFDFYGDKITKIIEFHRIIDEATSSAEVTAATEGVVEAAAEATTRAAATKDPDAAKAAVEAANTANDIVGFGRVIALLMEFEERTGQAKASAEVTATTAKVTVAAGVADDVPEDSTGRAAKRPRGEDP